MSPTAPTSKSPLIRLRRPVSATLLALAMAAGAHAADFATTISVPAASQTQGGTLVQSSGTVTYTVGFAQAAYPKYLATARNVLLGTNAADLLIGADVYGTGVTAGLDFTGTSAWATKTVRVVDPQTLQVVVSGLRDGDVASLAATAGFMLRTVSGGDTNLAASAKAVRSIQADASSYTVTSALSDYTTFKAPVMLGDFFVSRKARLDVNLAGVNNAFQVLADTAGVAGNYIQFAIAISGTDNTVATATSGAGTQADPRIITATAGSATTIAELITAVNGDVDANVITLSNLNEAGLSSGAGVVAAYSATALSGGTDATTNPPFADYTVLVKEGATTLGTATTATNGTWVFSPPTTPAIGLHTYTFTPGDAAGSAGVSAGDVTWRCYVANDPTITGIEQTDGASLLTYGTANGQTVRSNHGKPELRGLAGLPKVLPSIDPDNNSSTDTGLVKVTIDIEAASAPGIPVIPQVVLLSADLTAGADDDVDSAIWDLTAAHYGAVTLSNGTNYKVKIQTSVYQTTTGGTTLSSVGLPPISYDLIIDSSGAGAPVLSTTTGGSNNRPNYTINVPDGVGDVTAVAASYAALGANQLIMRQSTDGGASYSDIAGAIAAAGDPVTWRPTTAIGDSTFKLKAYWKDESGIENASNALDVTIATPTPTLTFGSGSTDDTTPGLTVAISGTGNVPVTNKLIVDYSTDAGATYTSNAAGTGTVTGSDPYTWTPNSPLANGTYKFKAKWISEDNVTSVYGGVLDLVIGVKIPSLTVTSGAANHKPTITVAVTDETVGDDDADVDMEMSTDNVTFADRSGTVTAGVWTPSVCLPDGTYYFRAKWRDSNNVWSSAYSTTVSRVITTPRPVLVADGFATANVDVLASLPTADGNNQYLISDLLPKIKVGAWADFNPANGTFEMYQVSRGTTGVQITPYALANDLTGYTITNTITAGGTPGALIAGTVTADGADAVWTPNAALTNEASYSLFAKWTDAKAANATADDSNATNGSEVNAVALASTVFNLRVLSAVDAPALTGYSPSTDNNDTPDTAYTGTSIVVADGAIQIQGTGNPYATLQMFTGAAQDTQLASITVQANGKWIYEFSSDVGSPTTELGSGLHFLSFRQLDLASGTPSAFAPQVTVTVSDTAPTTPVITKLEDSTTDGVKTADTTPEFEGTASPGSTVNLYALAATALTSAGTDNNLQFVSKNQGNAVTLSLVESGNNTPLSVVTSGTASPYTITVNLATDGSGNSTTTANAVITLIRADTTASGLISIALAGADTTGNLGTGVIPASVSASSDAGTLSAAVTVSSVLADVGTGAWATSTARTTPTLTAAAAPGLLHRIFARGVSPSAVASGYSDGRDIYIVTPSMKIYLEPVAKGDGGSYTVAHPTAGTYAIGTSTIALAGGSETAYNTATADVLQDYPNVLGDILVGDVVTFAGDTNIYTVVSGLRGASGSITISPALKATKANGVAMTVGAISAANPYPNPKGPTSKGMGNNTPTSQAQILLTATFKDDSGNPIDEVLAAGFPASKVAITGGTVTTVTKGTGAVGQRPTNVWTIAITPSTTDGLMTVSIPEGRIGTTPAKILDALTIVQPGAHYVGTPTFVVGGGATGSAVLTWTDAANWDHDNNAGTAMIGDRKIQSGELVISDPGYGFAGSATISVVPSPGSGAAGLPVAVASGSISTVTVAGVPTAVVLETEYNVATQGTGYTAAPAVEFVGGAGTSIVAPLASAVISAGKVTKVKFHTLGSGYTSAPTMFFRTGSGFSATASLKDGQIVYNEASRTFTTGFVAGGAGVDDDTPADGTTYTIDVDRTKPKAEWQYVSTDAAALRTDASVDTTGEAFPATGNYVIVTGSSTSFTIRADFGATAMSRDLVASDLTLVGCSLVSITDVNSDNKKFDIKVQRGGAPSTVATMSVTIKAAPIADIDPGVGVNNVTLTDMAEPKQPSLASSVFSAAVVTTPTAPIITSQVGSASVASRTVSYPVSVTFSTPVTGFVPSHLSVTNGVISKFTGSGKSYTFTLTPGEGQVSVQYLQSALAAPDRLKDVAQQLIPDSNIFQRTLDSTQPLVEAVSSPVFGVGGAVKPTNFTTEVVSGVTLAVIPLRLTFSEAPKTVPTTALVATYVSSGAVVSLSTPTVVGGTANKIYTVNLRIPQTLIGKVRLVVPALSVPDNATNQGAASGVYELNFDMTAGTPVNISTAPFSNG